MSGYIDRDALLKRLPEDLPYKASVKRVLIQAPTADVVEVRHGEWREVNDTYPRYVCTVCNHLFNNKNYNYCPCCGANMDGERREE